MSRVDSSDDPTPSSYNSYAWIIGEPEIGDGTWIGAFTVIDGSGGLRVGSNCDISAGAQIYTHSTVRRCLSDGELSIDRASTTVGDNVHVGAGAIILMGATIGSNSVVGAGCVVPEFMDVAPGSVVVGVPARVVRTGALEHISNRGTSSREGSLD